MPSNVLTRGHAEHRAFHASVGGAPFEAACPPAGEIRMLGPGGYRPPRSSRAFGLGGTVLLFAAAISAFLLVLQSPAVRPAPASRLAVTFELATVPAAPPAPPVEVPPGPVQHEQEASTAARPISQPVPPVIPLPAPPPDAAGPIAEGKAADRPASDRRAVEQTTAPPSVATASAAVAARVNTASMEKAALANWQSALLGHLKGFLRYPRQAQSARQEGIALVSVSVDRQGRVLAVRIERGSGYPALDSEAVAMVRRGSPMPPPTADIRGDPVSVTIPIQFSLRR